VKAKAMTKYVSGKALAAVVGADGAAVVATSLSPFLEGPRQMRSYQAPPQVRIDQRSLSVKAPPLDATMMPSMEALCPLSKAIQRSAWKGYSPKFPGALF
jgi:hypothetical protein